MLRNEKVAKVQFVSDLLGSNAFVLLAHYHGIDAHGMASLRRSALQDKCTILVVKNTLARLAVQVANLNEVKQYLSGPVVIAAAQDLVGAAKLLVKFSEQNEKFKILAGVANGAFVTPQQIEAISKLPSLDQIRSKIISLLLSSPTKIASVIQAPLQKVVRVVTAYGTKTQD